MKRKLFISAKPAINGLRDGLNPQVLFSGLLLIGLMLIGNTILIAQSAFSVLRGTVTDSSGAVVVGVQITMTDLATNIAVRKVTTDANGNYEIPDVKLGNYRLMAEKQGFRSFVADGVVMDAGQTRRIDFTLQIGATSETVTVEGGAALINTETGSIGGEVNNKKFKDQPAVDAYPSPLAMLTTVPGIQGNGWNLVMSGQGRGQQTWAMDGVSNDTTADQNDNPNFFQTVQVSTVNSGADSARVTNFNMVSKRGANQFHFGGFYRHFNSALNSRNFFEASSNRKITPFIQHEWNGEVSGPIWKDRTFFYASWFHQIIPLGSFVNSSVPTVDMRNGIFPTAIRDPLTGAAFPNNRIPVERMSPVSLKVQDLYFPLPNQGNPASFVNNYGYIFPYNSDLYKGDWPFFRIDHNLTKNNNLFFRWGARITPYIRPRPTEKLGYTEDRDHRQTVIADTHVFSSHLINTFTFGWQTDLRHRGEKEKSFEPLQGDAVVSAIGLQGVNRGGYSTQGFPRMAITGLSTLEVNTGGIDDVLNDEYIRSWLDTLTWSRGRHVVKFGGEYREYKTRSGEISSDVYGNFTFDGTYTGSPYGDFLLGIPRSATRLDPVANRTTREKQVGFFVSDSFKITQKLTIDFGLRWDYYSSPTLDDGLMYNWNPTTGNVVVAAGTLSQVSPLYPRSTIGVVEGQVVPVPDKKNIRPRLSAAYRLTDKTVIRGGYGEYTETFDHYSRRLTGGPFQLSETYQNPNPPAVPTLFFPNPFPSSTASASVPGQSVTALPLSSDNGVIRQYNLSVEREWRDIGFRASYIGSRGSGLNYSLNVNKPQPSTIQFTTSRRPYPQFASTTAYRTDGENRYNSLQLSAQRRLGMMTFDASWTWSSNMYNYGNLENPYNVTSNWARDAATRRHYAVINTVWSVPVGKGRKFMTNAPAIANLVIGGWDLQTISYFGSGIYFSPAFSGNDPSNTGTSGGLPDRIAEGNLPGDQRTYARWFDQSAFRAPAAGHFGNSGVNILEGQGLNVHHLSVAKRFPVTERFKMSFTTAISNLFNKPHFNNPNNNITTGAGAFTTTIPYYNPEKQGFRQMSMTLRFEF